MDLPWGDEKTIQFITNVGLISSRGPHGDNVMAAEWTHMVSYKPGIILISLGPKKATTENIRASRQFGVSLASVEQAVAASIAGGSTGREVDKVSVLKELGVAFYPAKKINALMVQGAALNLECTVIQEIPLGDHIGFAGEVVSAFLSGKEPLAYHKGAYWKVDSPLPKPLEEERARIHSIVQKHVKSVPKQ